MAMKRSKLINSTLEVEPTGLWDRVDNGEPRRRRIIVCSLSDWQNSGAIQ
jgi:hypothetical protein